MSGDETLPDYFDVIILGSGLPESILAAACSRSELSLLHLDRNDYYGGKWASFNLHGIHEWENKLRFSKNSEKTLVDKSLLKENEELVLLFEEDEISDIRLQWHINEEEQENSSITTEGSKNDMDGKWRLFNIDLLPKVLLSRGEMVQLLCDSSVSKYCQFKCVDRFLCWRSDGETSSKRCNNDFDIVPCSRADIFQNTNLSPLEKRRIMRFFSLFKGSGEKLDENPDWAVFAEKPFDDFLEQYGLNGKLKNYIADTVGILQTDITTKAGLKAVRRFLESLGRFGNSPFLWTLYGSGELSQCYCRLCAVFGGIYCLSRSINGIILSDERVVAVITNGQRIDCRYLIADSSYLPQKYIEREHADKIFRAALISDSSLLYDPQKDHISLLNLKRLDPDLSAWLLEVGYEGCATPKNYFLSHITASGNQDISKLQLLIQKLYRQVPDTTEGDRRPRLLWSFTCSMIAPKVSQSSLPRNLRVVPVVDALLDYSDVVQKTRAIFEELWSDRDFLPPSLRNDEDLEDEEITNAQTATTNSEDLSAEKNGKCSEAASGDNEKN